jgi:hypothetical protein
MAKKEKSHRTSLQLPVAKNKKAAGFAACGLLCQNGALTTASRLP